MPVRKSSTSSRRRSSEGFACVNKKLADLTPDRKNANKGTERGKLHLDKSLRTYGAGRSILLDKNGVIIAGNKTAESAGSVGLDDVLVVKTDGTKLVAVQRTDLDLETDAAAKELAIADNRTGEVGLSWDPATLQELQVDLAKFWSEDELEKLFAEPRGPLLTDEDAVPETPAEPVTKPGDLYALGPHRLLCGDSTRIDDVEHLMGGMLADLVVTDPPYNVSYEGKTKDALTIENDSMDGQSFFEFLYAAHRAMFAVMKPGAGVYVFHADTEGLNFRRALVDAGFKFAQTCVWVKQSMVMGRQDYHWQHEPVLVGWKPGDDPKYYTDEHDPILYGWKPGAAHNWHADRKQTTVWRFDRPSRSTEHPTMKPVALVEYPLQNSSKAGDVVLDLFGGSGSTLIACEKIGRRARLMELDPKYCDVIVKRWEDATGNKAKRVHAKAA